jgi:uncharacterized protein YdiU (UPF0061 family)
MNTDNMSILGLTMDYGPYGFLDDFNPTLSATTPIIRAATVLKTSRRLGCGICNVSRSRCRRLSAVERLMPRWMTTSTPADGIRPRMRDKLGLFTQQKGDNDLLDGLFALMIGKQRLHPDFPC